MASDLKDKLALLPVAATLAAAVIGNLPDTAKTDPDTVDPETVNENAMEFRLLRTFYSWLCQSLADDVMFPAAPAGIAGGAAGGGGGTLTPDTLLASIQGLLASPQKASLMSMLQTAMAGGTVNAPPAANPSAATGS